MWEKFEIGTSCKGCLVEGDTTVSPTRWWNHLWLLRWGWRTAVVFEVKTDKVFRVGFRNKWGKAYINTKLLNTSAKLGQLAESEMRDDGKPMPPVAGPKPRLISDPTRRWPHFNALIGFESCIFFAIDVDDTEVPITLIKRVGRNEVSSVDGTSL